MKNNKVSELTVFTKAKDLASYVLTVTESSPKRFRFTFVSRLQNLSLSIIENIFRANKVFLTKGDEPARLRRLDFQREAQTDLELLDYLSQLAATQGCITMHQFEQISRLGNDCRNLLEAWAISDSKRLA